jgi:transketolase
MQSNYTERDHLAANTVRMLAADAVQQANSGHPGLPLGAADIAIVLWTRFLKHNPANPTWFNRDRFVLSAGHGSMLLYALLHLDGYPMPLEQLKQFRQWDSLTPGHPEYDPERGIETTTGPLGQGFADAVGIALAERMLAARFNQPDYPVVDHHTYVLASDGDLMEGISHEAASLAGHLGLNRLIVFYDDNHITIDGPTSLAYSDDVEKRFEGYHWYVQKVDGHDMPAIDAAIRKAGQEPERPCLIMCRTHIGLKSPLQDNSKVHGSPLGEDNLVKTKEAYHWPLEPRFYVPEELGEYFGELNKQGQAAEAAWQMLFAGYQKAHPEKAADLEGIMQAKLAAGWEKFLPQFSAEKPMATRVASGKVLEAIAPHLVSLVGGSADLTPSNNTLPPGEDFVKKGDYRGGYVHFGIREHAMAGIMNGMVQHGLRPYGGTFLIFSDYMRPSIRLAALMKLPVIYVFTHDSVGLGEDGPTHQPVEQITALRAIPNLVVLRPADANETAAAWKVALERKDGPTALALTRQGLPVITPVNNAASKGAYILADAGNAKPDLVLVATGSEVSLAMAARQVLTSQSIAARVVSMPSWELFEAQSEAYKRSVLPTGVPCLGIEAGVTLAWPRYVGADPHAVVGLDRFGASAPYKVVFEKFGFTADNVVEHAKKLLGKA